MGGYGVQVPYILQDDEIPDDWECSQNIWDKEHNSCTVPQALTDEEIDEILSLQVNDDLHQKLSAAFRLHMCTVMRLLHTI